MNILSNEFYFNFLDTVVDQATQTSSSITYNTPRKLQMRRTIKNLSRRLYRTSKSPAKPEVTAEDVGNFFDQHYSQNFSNFVKMQMSVLGKTPKGARYTNEYKQFALALYFSGPQAYKFLSKTLQLPSKSTLYRITSKWEISAGFNDFIFNALKLKVDSLEDNAKDCVICVDEMSIKSNLFYNISKDEIIGFHEIHNEKKFEPANNALVVMARGINADWKQPIAYFLLNASCSVTDLKDIIFKSVEKVNGIGLNTLAIISDQGSNFYKLVKKILKISIERPYFFVGDSKVFYLFDIPHLLKSTRNNFFEYQLHFDGGVTNKYYLEKCYELDKNKQYRLAHKLTNDHINPNNFQKMKVKLAAQVFSNSVAVAMNTYMCFGEIPATAAGTVSFIEKMDQLFDMLNSNRFTDCKEFNKPFMGTDKQINFLSEIDNLFKNLKVKDSSGKDFTTRMKFIFGWRLTISSFLSLWQDLKNKNVKHVLTRRFNQDCLENYFGKVRNACGNARNPTPIQFSRAFKKLFALQYFEQSEGANCLDDFDEILCYVSPDVIKNYECLVPTSNRYVPLKIDTRDYLDLTTSEGNALVYVSGYFMKKCLEKHTCDVCLKYASSKTELDPSSIYSHFKAYVNRNRDTFGNLKMPHEHFLNYIAELENEFCNNFNNMAINKQVGFNLKEKFKVISYFHPCINFPIDYFLSLFVRVRIYYTIKFANRELKSCKANKQNPKLIILQNL